MRFLRFDSVEPYLDLKVSMIGRIRVGSTAGIKVSGIWYLISDLLGKFEVVVVGRFLNRVGVEGFISSTAIAKVR